VRYCLETRVELEKKTKKYKSVSVCVYVLCIVCKSKLVRFENVALLKPCVSVTDLLNVVNVNKYIFVHSH
jgi:hypothetical protein